jgi:membrane associated rhomboid family serine protease
MGIYDRDYNRDDTGLGYRGRGVGGGTSNMFVRAPGWSVNTWIIVINITVHLLMITALPVLFQIGHLSVFQAFQRLEVWRLITFQFLHDPSSIWHILFNMFGLWIFGPMVEQFLGGKKYLAFYLMCGLCGGLLFSILTVLGNLTGGAAPGLLTNDLQMPLIGASAGVFGVIVACAYIQPNTIVQLLFPPIPMKLKWFAYGYVGLALVQLLMGSANAGGEAAHVGGAVAGYYFIRNSHHLLDFFDVFNDSRDQRNAKKAIKTQQKRAKLDQEVDRILAKVARDGIGSLTDAEKKTLNDASREQRHAG